MNQTPTTSPEVSKIIDLSQFKKKKENEAQIARGRKPLYVDSQKGHVSGQSASNAATGDFSDRLTKIKGSLDRINQLMTEIKKLSAQPGTHQS